MTSGFVEKELFGGAMVVQVPEGFLDVRYVVCGFFYFT